MKALLCTHYGTPEELQLADLPDPVPQAGEIVVRVKAAALNFFDTLIIQGKYQTKPAFPFSPSAEFAGVVESVGPGVSDFKAGDRVLGFTGYGAARELIAVPAQALTPIPDELDFDRAAGLCVTYGTTLYALKNRAHLKPGETLAVLGASGGVGLAAIEIGKLMGARVIACASSPEKLDFARKHGADEGIDYATENLKDGLRRVTGGTGADVIYDPVGGAYAEAALRGIAWEGRYLVIGFAAGDIPKVPFNLYLLKSANVLGVFWGAWTERDPDGHRANTAQLLKWAAEGHLSSHVHAVYPLSEAAAALRAIAERKVMGKVILRP
ncbi:NADPH:quinone oxidoreductase family protein [Pseudolabrys sp. FHR47]|uniref:NADPH:quinone oxidoreductase family protein n=1 Tax=Pseudolabrys sp. FHR47 TaxID=2562284 RepID=UPI0010BE58EB|nr:NADPH:quinone oxidoreductase family protein [Pseudolabrys sp. FHR47]